MNGSESEMIPIQYTKILFSFPAVMWQALGKVPLVSKKECRPAALGCRFLVLGEGKLDNGFPTSPPRAATASKSHTPSPSIPLICLKGSTMSIEEDNTLEVVPQSDPRPAKKRKISKEKKEKFVNKAPEEDVETKMAFPTVLHKEEGDSTMFVDAGNLMVANLAVDAADITTSNMTEHVTQCTQELVNRLFMLKPIPSDVGRAVTLPARRTLLPREKPMPKPKAKTVWEQFAEKKGIVKKKKLTRKFDEDIGDWSSSLPPLLAAAFPSPCFSRTAHQPLSTPIHPHTAPHSTLLCP